MTEEISPIEAGLTWTIGKSRREDCAFLGGDRIKRELAEGVKQKRIGLLTQGPPARAHSDLLEPESCRKVRSHIKSLLHLCVSRTDWRGHEWRLQSQSGEEYRDGLFGKGVCQEDNGRQGDGA